MSGIRTAIELQDNFSDILYQITNAVNLSLSAMEDMNRVMNDPVDTSSMEGAREAINAAAIAAQQYAEAMRGIEAPEAPSPAAPFSWQSDNFETFTSSGVERFQQEIQSANNMLNALNATQERIAATAAGTDLFSENAVVDMNNMQSRLAAIQQRIMQIESDPMNLGADAANNELEQLRIQLNQAVREQEALNRAVDNMNVEAANQAYLRLSRTVGNTERYIRENTVEQGRFNQEIAEGTQDASQLMNTIKGFVGAYAGIQGLTAVISTSDQLTSTQARVNLMNDGLQSTDELMTMIYESAQRSRGDFTEMAAVVARFGNNAKDAFSSSAEAVQFAELVQKQMTIAGAGTAEASNAILQLSQALGSGVLRGDELNSVFEQAPNLIQNIADYMGKPIGSIREMAQEGELTADIVKNAVFAAADETNAKFESMPATWAQTWTVFKNAALMAFRPVLQRINEIANSEVFQVFVNNAVKALNIISSVVMSIFTIVGNVASVIYENWSWISPIIYGVAAALAVYYGWQLLVKGAALAMAAAQAVVNFVMTASPIMLVVLGVILLIAVFYAAVAAVNHFAGTSVSATGIICGAFMVVLAVIGNIFVALYNLVIDIFAYLWNFIAAFANFFGNVFTDPVGAVARLFFDLVDNILSLLQSLAGVIDTIFGSNLAGVVQGWRDNLSGWVDDTFGTGTVFVEEIDPEQYHRDRFVYTDAWNSGKTFGEGVEDKFSNWFNGFDDLDIPQEPTPIEPVGIDTEAEELEGIAADVSDIADAVSFTDEELKLLRKIAERGAINRFTTAEVKLYMENHNRIDSDFDIDGMYNGLINMLEGGLKTAAEGVYA